MIVALAQLTSLPDLAHNMRTCTRLVREAHARGARWVLLPENAPFLGKDRQKLDVAQGIDGEIVSTFRQLARELQMAITLGSFPERSPSPDHTYNTQVMIGPDGEILATYRKIHLFDVTFADGSSLKESATFLPGEQSAMASLALGEESWQVGLSICYDLRFPELYRHLLAQGAQILTVPSAFTLETGREHWHALLRARAIENQCYVLAPNQFGTHLPGRHSYGQSAIYDPWGRLLASAPEREGVITAELSLEDLLATRRRMPCQSHQRPDLFERGD